MRMTKAPLTNGLAPLVRALAKRAGAWPVIGNVHSRPWSSATFNGARHHFSVRFEGVEAESRIRALCDGLDYAEFDLGAHILVDIAVLECRSDDNGSMITIEALTVDND